MTGFSSKHTTGSAGSYGFSYVSSTSSILAMYSSLSSATHHIFFPPRLEVVVEEQDADCFPSHPRNQSPFDGFLRHQTHRPAGAAFGRIAAHHGDNPLLLAVIEHRGGAGALLLEQRGFQTALLVTMADRANGLRGERDDPGNPRCAGASGQLQQAYPRLLKDGPKLQRLPSLGSRSSDSFGSESDCEPPVPSPVFARNRARRNTGTH